MYKYLFPFAISATFVAVLQLSNYGINIDKKPVLLNKNENVDAIDEIYKYLVRFNPNLSDTLNLSSTLSYIPTNNFNTVEVIEANSFTENFRIMPNPAAEADNKHIKPDIIHNYRVVSEEKSRVGYISVISLKTMAYASFMTTMEKLAGKQGIDTLYIDLRRCSDGLDVEVVKIANQFFVREGVRMLEEYFFNGNKNEFKSTGKAFFPVKHIYLMVGKNTGPMPILLCRMLAATGYTSILGSKTQPVPPVVRYFPLSDGRYVRLPVGTYRFYSDENDAFFPALTPPAIDRQLDSIQLEKLIHL